MSAERRPLGRGAAHGESYRAGSDKASIPPPGDNPAELPPPAWAAYVAGYEAGFGAGLDRGRQVEAAELDAAWATVAAAVRRAADVPPFAELRRRRGVAA